MSADITVMNGNVCLHATVFERPDSESIILLHGGPGVPDEMTEICDFLSPYFQIIRFEQRGTGKRVNDHCTFMIADYISDLEAIRKHFSIEKFHLFGHSWGGLYAQIYAKEYPWRILSLFLCSPASGTGRIWSMTEHEISRYNFHRATTIELLGMIVNTVLSILGYKNAFRKLFRQLIINYHKGYNVAAPDDEKIWKIGLKAVTQTRREIKRYPELELFGYAPYPVIITYGDNDAYGSSCTYQLARFPSARHTIIPSSGHTPWKHNLPFFQSLLREFYIYSSTTPPGWSDYVK